jgi:NAD(P)-dependent dehydrogenase (short-subunit alcohol dehydrogenase family)
MTMGLVQDKVAIVTGAGANIGEACAKMLASHGAKVVVADINAEGAERVAGEITTSGWRMKPASQRWSHP